MECYTSDSCDSDAREQKTLDLTGQMLGRVAIESTIEECATGEKKSSDQYEIMLLSGNRMTSVPDSVARFINLKVLDISNNRLTSLPDILRTCPLASLTLKHNCLTNDSLPKSFHHPSGTLKELNLSGNMLTSFPEQLLELSSLKYLFLGANNITNVPKDIWRLKR